MVWGGAAGVGGQRVVCGDGWHVLNRMAHRYPQTSWSGNGAAVEQDLFKAYGTHDADWGRRGDVAPPRLFDDVDGERGGLIIQSHQQ